MCVMICAIPKFEAWLDVAAAVDYRNALQLTAAFNIGDAGRNDGNGDGEVSNIETSHVASVMKRSAWLQVYFRRLAERQRTRKLLAADDLPEDRHHAFDAIAHAWRRLLALFGWRDG